MSGHLLILHCRYKDLPKAQRRDYKNKMLLDCIYLKPVAKEEVAEETENTLVEEETETTQEIEEQDLSEEQEEQKEETPQEEKKPRKIPKQYHISLRVDQKWQLKYSGSTKAIKLFNTQKEAIEYAKPLAAKQKAALIIHRTDGKIRKL